MISYWDSSWQTVDENRLLHYIHSFDMQSDSIIELLRAQDVRTVCDAGCGCGIYTLKLTSKGFDVSGFDISDHAVQIARNLLQRASAKADLKSASILSTGYTDGQFDCAISRDVIDHMTKSDAAVAITELYRIVRPGGLVLFTLDHSDDDYESQPHSISTDGDYLFTDGKWQGMVFHPYSEQEIHSLLPSDACIQIDDNGSEILVCLTKPIQNESA